MPYLFDTDKPRIFAHRGLALDSVGGPLDENTLPAFARALEVGAHYIESDIQVSADGVPVLFHDDDLKRVAGIDAPVQALSVAEIQAIKLENGGQIPTLVEALQAFPAARFNLDFKSVASIFAGTREIQNLGAAGRIMVASFSDARRMAAKSKLPGVASSAGSSRVLQALVGSALRIPFATGISLDGVDALQIPTHFGALRLDSKRFIKSVQKAGAEVHFWTINDTDEMQRLIALGANGIVTDRADLAVAALLG